MLHLGIVLLFLTVIGVDSLSTFAHQKQSNFNFPDDNINSVPTSDDGLLCNYVSTNFSFGFES